MDEKLLLEVISQGMGLASSTVGPMVGALMTTLFLRKNTETTEFEKIKAGKFGEVAEQLLNEGKMTYLEYWKCRNFLDIAKIADERLKGEAPKDNYDAYDFDWYVRFYDYASNISNEEFQNMWASVLAREVSSPGTTSVSLLNALSMMSREQATLFCNISIYAFKDVPTLRPQLLLFVSANREVYKVLNITPEGLKQLERLGLIECDFSSEFIYTNKKILRTGNKNITIYGDPDNDKKIKAGNVNFTKDGQTLYAAIDDDFKMYRPDILDFTVSKLKARNCRVLINDREV